ncbi:MAG: integration host factor subunit alpha [Desulfobacterales bacterium]|jgi:integration host factor subunit alpha|nr:integration host factor subunit alpha [Desulfobacterales bacterium]
MTLTKVDIIESVRNDLGFPRKKSADILEMLLEIIKKSMENGEDILISGFGKFCVNEKRARRGRNPATGDDMMLEKRRVITFKCSQVLRKRMNQE